MKLSIEWVSREKLESQTDHSFKTMLWFGLGKEGIAEIAERCQKLNVNSILNATKSRSGAKLSSWYLHVFWYGLLQGMRIINSEREVLWASLWVEFLPGGHTLTLCTSFVSLRLSINLPFVCSKECYAATVKRET